jgi:catechol 2,3-dioxygenase
MEPLSIDMQRPEDLLTASLHYLVVQSANPGGLADFYDRSLGYHIELRDGQWLASAPHRNLVIAPGAAKSLAGIGFGIAQESQLIQLRARLNKAGWNFREGATALFSVAVSLDDPDGNCIAFGVPRPQPIEAAADIPPARLQHVVMASSNAERITHFFSEVLGFTVSDRVIDDKGELKTAFLRCSHEHHSFAVFQAAENRFDHHCYETTDWNTIRDWCDRMAGLHIPIKWGPGRHGPGNNLFVFVHDLDGNWVEISAELESVTHERPAGVWPHEQRTLNSWGEAPLRS